MTFNSRLEERSYLLPKRVELALTLVEIIAKEKFVNIIELMEATNFSRAYILACCSGLKRHGILVSKQGKRGGYSLSKDSDKITVGDVLEAVSRAEDRGAITVSLDRFLMGKAKDLTIKELIDGKG